MALFSNTNAEAEGLSFGGTARSLRYHANYQYCSTVMSVAVWAHSWAAMGTLCEFLGRYDAEGLQGRFEAAGLQTVEDLVAAGLGEAELIKLGVEPLWRRRSLLSGIAEAKRDKVSVCLCRAACAAH